MENLFRRFKGEVVDVKTVSGGIYAGRIIEVTNDYVCLTETSSAPGQQVFLILQCDRIDGSSTRSVTDS